MKEVEELTGDNQWFCDEANAKVDAERGWVPKKFPNVVAIHLMRFVYDLETMRRKKLSNIVDIPLELDLSEFASGAGIYSLSAVCFHKGSSYGGHYYAWTKGPGPEDQWMVCNDEHKAPLYNSVASLMLGDGRLKGDLSAPYFLLYRKKSLPIAPLVPNIHEGALRKEHEDFEDMHRLYQIHRDI